ncbi:MAG: response regulator [Lachnospiraceae bacterium]|nr:response regulator [Lachnospiraceae bacterium]
MYRVLIVDDDRLARQGIISMMPWEKYDMMVVGEAQNGEKALEVLTQTQVDLLFVDLDMPVMDGISLMEKCHALYPGIFFVVLTFYEDFYHVQSALRIGAIDYISKLQMESLDCDQLLGRISQKVEDIMAQQISKHKNDRKNASGSGLRGIPAVCAFDEKEWKSLVQRWNEMYWLFDDTVFEELCSCTKEMDIPIRKIEQVLLPLTHHAEESISIAQKDVSDYQNVEGFLQWLASFRKALYQKASQEVSLAKMPLCIMKAVLYVKEHLGAQLHAEETAQIINLSRSYFSINFKKHTGVSFKEFVRRERIRAAQVLLVEKDALIADIAQSVGYEDVNYFIRVFFKITGMTPGEYRKQHGKSRR